MKKVLMMIGVGLLLCSCTNDNSLTKDIENSFAEQSYKIPLDEALRYAEKQYANVYGGDTRSYSSREVSKIEYLKPDNTRSNQNAEGFYIVNYNDDKGFSILSADRRLDPIYAISDKGSLHISDTINNDGLKWYIDNILFRDIDMIQSGAITKPVLPPPLDSLIVEKPNEQLSIPMLTGFKANFHQRAPYNKYCYTTAGEQAVTGCAPLAIGTVMGKYHFPESIDGYVFNWTAMDNDANHDGWSQLFERLGRSDYLNANYGVDSTGCYSSTYVPTFIKLGRQYVKLEDFDSDLLAVLLKDWKVTLVRGESESGNHIWVVDGGYIDNSGPVALYPGAPQKYMFHCVWGWGGTNNGYFLYKSTNGSIDSGKYVFKSLQMIYGY